MGGACSSPGDDGNAYRSLVGNPARENPFRRHKQKWQDNIKMCLKEIGLEVVDLIHLAKDRAQWRDLAKENMNFCGP
jgi:hypothetical protein